MRPDSAIASHDSVPPMTAQVAIDHRIDEAAKLVGGLSSRVGQLGEDFREEHDRHGIGLLGLHALPETLTLSVVHSTVALRLTLRFNGPKVDAGECSGNASFC